MFFRKRANATVIAPAYPVPPSNGWDGNDGSWSTFNIYVGGDASGNNAQTFRMLPSTSSPLTIVPGNSSWCDSTCAQARGVDVHNGQQPLGYSTATSESSWNSIGLYNIPLATPSVKLWPDTNPNASWGTDNVGLGMAASSGPGLAQQWVVQGITEDFFMGSFGLASLPVDVGQGPRAPFLTNFASANGTSSISYGYAAGAYYQNNSKGIVGSLVLGGYDQSRFGSQNTTIAFPNAGNNTLAIGVQSIVYVVGNSQTSFTADTGGGFGASIDSTLPYLWLPDAVCDQFVSKFQLTYDSTRNLYKVNDTAHRNNLDTNATLSFVIGSGVNTHDTVNIVLPYAAFDLEANAPIYNNATRYFPIKKSPTGVFVLGRAFLQEAYLIVDYERNEFTLAPAVWSDPMPASHIVTIFPTNYVAPASASGTTTSSSHKHSLGGGAIAGIVIGVLAIFALLGLGFFFWKRRRDRQRHLSEKGAPPSEIDTMVAGNEVKHRRVSELDSEHGSPKAHPAGTYYGSDRKDGGSPFPPINEMESPPAELYSPPPGETPASDRPSMDYFTGKMRRRGATRESSGNNTPGTPGVTTVHELPGDDGQFQVQGLHFEPVGSNNNSPAIGPSPLHSRGPSDTSLNTNIDEVLANSREPSRAPPVERRPSLHQRGPSDVPSESTAVSNPSPEELESWAMGGEHEHGPQRPLSPE